MAIIRNEAEADAAVATLAAAGGPMAWFGLENVDGEWGYADKTSPSSREFVNW